MLNLRRRDFVSLLGGRVAACFASPLTEEHRDAGFELSAASTMSAGNRVNVTTLRRCIA